MKSIFLLIFLSVYDTLKKRYHIIIPIIKTSSKVVFCEWNLNSQKSMKQNTKAKTVRQKKGNIKVKTAGRKERTYEDKNFSEGI